MSARGAVLASVMAARAALAQTETPPVVVTPPPTPALKEQAKKEADQAAPAVANPTPPTAGFVAGEGFRIRTADGDWKLRVGLQAAGSYVPTFTGSVSNWSQFRVPYARLRVDGNVFKSWLRYWVSFELSAFPPFLLDGYVEAQPFKLFGVRLGQMFTPISRHEYSGPQELLFPDWAIVADYFWTGRDKGIQVFGEGDRIWYYAGLYAGSPLRQTFTTAGNYQLMARVTVSPLGPMGWAEIPWAMAEGDVPFRFSFSLQGWGGKVTPSAFGFNASNGFYQRTEGPERRQGAFAADVMVQYQRFGFLTELYWRRLEATTQPTPAFSQLGWWAQANVTFYKRMLDLAVRFNFIDPSTDLANDTFLAGEAQLSWFVKAPYVTLKLRYAVGRQLDPGPPPASDPNLFDLVSLPLSPGVAHQLTLQAMLYF